MPTLITTLTLAALIVTSLAAPLRAADDAAPGSPAPMRVRAMTFNIRYDNSGDGVNRWSHRTAAVGKFIHDVDADFIGMQEVLPNQLADLHRLIDDRYTALSRARNAEPDSGEANPLWWRSDRWRLDPDPDEHGTFWLSTTPQEPGSQSWGTSLPRICTWARLIERGTHRAIYVFNTHFDHRSEAAREHAAKLIADRIARRTHHDDPALLLGDFNSTADAPPIRTLIHTGLIDTWPAAHPNEARTPGTFHGFTGRTDEAKIDFIFVAPAKQPIAVPRAVIHSDKVDGRYVSDHFPVSAEVVLP